MPTEQYSKGGAKTHLKANHSERFGAEYIGQTKTMETKKTRAASGFLETRAHSNFWPALVTGEGEHVLVNSNRR